VIASSTATVSNDVLAVWNNAGLTGRISIKLMINDYPSPETTVSVTLGDSAGM